MFFEDYQDSFDPGVVDSIRNKYQFKKGYAIEFNRLEMMDYMIVELFDPGSVINIFYDDLFSVRDLKEEFALNSNLNKFHEQFNDDDEY